MRAVALVALVAIGCAETESPTFEEPTGAGSSDGISEEWTGRDRYDVYFGAGQRVRARYGPIYLNPGDLSTGLRSEPWIFLEVPLESFGREDVPALAARYRLVTWPDREEVPTDAVYENGGSRSFIFSFVLGRA